MGRLTSSARALEAAGRWCAARLGHRPRGIACRLGSLLLYRLPIRGFRQWEVNHRRAFGEAPSAAERRALVDSWLRNRLMSLALPGWGEGDVTSRAIVASHHVERLRASLAGPGLVVAMPHMGCWDFVRAWCATVGIKVVGIDAEGRPARQATQMGALRTEVRAGRMVCVLADLDPRGGGVDVPWPTDDHPAVVRVSPGPALLAEQTGADLRVVITVFRGDRVEILVSERIEVASIKEAMTDVVAAFAEGMDLAPTSWLVLQPFFLD